MTDNERCPMNGYCILGEKWREFEQDARGVFEKINDVHESLTEMTAPAKHLDQLPVIAERLEKMGDSLIAAASQPAQGVPRIVVGFLAIIIVVLILQDSLQKMQIGTGGIDIINRPSAASK